MMIWFNKIINTSKLIKKRFFIYPKQQFYPRSLGLGLWGCADGYGVIGTSSVYTNKSQILVSPNPVQETLHLSNYESFSDIKQMRIVNSLGTVISSFQPSTEISVSNLPAGPYFLLVKSNRTIEAIPFVKQ